MGTGPSKAKRAKTLPRRRSEKKARDVQVQPIKRSKSLLRRRSFKSDVKMELDVTTRRRSLSDGQLPMSFQHLRIASAPSGGLGGPGGAPGTTVRAPVEVAIPAREISNPSLSGYLDRRTGPLGEWDSCWCVLKDNTLYRYGAPIDDVTQDVLQLPGYEVRPCMPTADQKYPFELIHQQHGSEMFNAETTSDMEDWMAKVHVATQKLTLDSLSLENSNSLQLDSTSASNMDLEQEARKHWQKELLKLKKQQLLQEVLQQKEELTRKQEHRLVKSKQSSIDSASPPGLSSDDVSVSMDVSPNEHLLRDRAMLKQRKISTQLKLDMTQKQLGLHSTLSRKQKKRGFKIRGFKSDKASAESTAAALVGDHDFLETQQRELTQEMESIERELEGKERRILGDSPRPIGGRAAQRRKTFAAYSADAGQERGSTSGLRSRQGAMSTKNYKSYLSDPHLLKSLEPESLAGKLGMTSSSSQDALFSQPMMDVSSKVQLMSYTKLATSSDPVNPPPPFTLMTTDVDSSQASRHSWDLGSIPYVDTDLSATATRFLTQDAIGSHSCSSFHKSCDLPSMGSADYCAEVRGEGATGREMRPRLPRSASDSVNLRKAEISASALAEIAAFEELVQAKLSLLPA